VSYLDNKVLIYIQSGRTGEKLFFNRKTQGFTSRLRFPDYQLSFYDVRGNSIAVYFASMRRHAPSMAMWLAMSENDSTLTYNVTTVREAKK
jgi:hypothetical protein